MSASLKQCLCSFDSRIDVLEDIVGGGAAGTGTMVHNPVTGYIVEPTSPTLAFPDSGFRVGTTTPAEITGSAGELTIASKGLNKDIILDPIGTGKVKIPSVDGSKVVAIWAPDQILFEHSLIISNGGTLISKTGVDPVNPISADGHSNGINNTFIGINTGLANTTGNLNVFVGDNCGRDCINGDQNTFMGAEAGMYVTNGYMNTFLGANAGLKCTTGFLNVAVGCDCMNSGATAMEGKENVAIGAGAGVITDGNWNVYIGKASGSGPVSGDNNVGVGFATLVIATSAEDNTAVGANALQFTTGSYNVAVGCYALNANTAAQYNVALGRQALLMNTTGGSNTAVGHEALRACTDASSNSALGESALRSCTQGQTNTAIGAAALYYLDSGSGNVAVGHRAGFHETGSNTFYVDNQDRGSYAAGRSGSLLFGTFNAIPASQTLRINAEVTVIGDILFFTTGIGPVVKSPDGSRYRLKCANGGALSTELVTS